MSAFCRWSGAWVPELFSRARARCLGGLGEERPGRRRAAERGAAGLGVGARPGNWGHLVKGLLQSRLPLMMLGKGKRHPENSLEGRRGSSWASFGGKPRCLSEKAMGGQAVETQGEKSMPGLMNFNE